MARHINSPTFFLISGGSYLGQHGKNKPYQPSISNWQMKHLQATRNGNLLLDPILAEFPYGFNLNLFLFLQGTVDSKHISAPE